MNVHYIERPMVEIATVTGGCGYVYVSWIVINNVPQDVTCGISGFTIVLSSMDVSMTVMTTMITHNFTGLPDDTLFNITVIGTNINERKVSPASTAVKTMIIESMCAYKVH